jgi:hypothetical protein
MGDSARDDNSVGGTRSGGVRDGPRDAGVVRRTALVARAHWARAPDSPTVLP